MSRMCYTAIAFNQGLNAWDVSSVTDMRGMFHATTAFNQDLSAWDVSSVRNMDFMFLGVTLSTTNYDALLLGWSTQNVRTNVRFHAGNSRFSPSSQSARDTLTNVYRWVIIDGGASP